MSPKTAVPKAGVPKPAVPDTAAQLFALEATLEDPFYIATTQQPTTRPPRVLKYGDTFVVLDSRGDIAAASSGGSAGLFHHDTRYLSRLELLVNGTYPLLLGSNLRDDNSAFSVDLTNPDLISEQRIVLEKDTVHILRTIFLWHGTAYQRFAVRNYDNRATDLQLSILFENDFADLFEVRGSHRDRRGSATAKLRGDDQVLLTYHGLDGKVRCTALTFNPQPDRLTTDAAVYDLHLTPREMRPLFLAVSCDRSDLRPLPFLRGLILARRELRESTRHRTSVETSNNRFNEILCRSAADLTMLMTDTPEGRYPYAGIPWFSTTFGRDGLITALQMLWWSPDVAQGVLRRLAACQAKMTDPLADAQPGKILHEMRGGEMAALREVPFGLYYGSVDSTPLFVWLAGLYLERTGDIETIAALWPAIEAALGWIDGPGDPDRRRFRRIQARHRARSRQPGLEGFARRDLPCRRTPGGGRDRARGGSRLCLRRQAYGGALRRATWARRRYAQTRCASEPSCRAFRVGVLVPGDRNLRVGARRRQETLPRSHIECRTVAVHRHCLVRSGHAGRRGTAAATLLLGLGHPHGG
jgi:hypothetical protein